MANCYRSPRQEQVNLVVEFFSPRREAISLDLYLSPRQEQVSITSSSFASPKLESVRVWDPESPYYTNYIQQQDYEGQIVDWFQFKLYGPGGTKDLSPFLANGSFSYEDPRGGKITAKAILVDYDDETMEVLEPSRFGPNLSSGDEYYNRIKAHNQTSDSYAVFRCSIDGEIFSTPKMLLEDPQFDNGVCTLTLSDFTPLLEIENQSLGDILADEGDRVTAHQNILQCASAYHVPDVEIHFPDYLIRELRRTEGQPLAWIDAACRPYGGRRNFRYPSRLVIRPAQYPGPSVMDFVDEVNIKKFVFRENSQDLRNKFDANRLVPQNSNKVGEVPWKYGGELLGRNSQTEYTFEKPVASAYSIWSVTPGGGDLGLFSWFNGDTLLSGPSRAFSMSSKPATKVVWTYTPSLPWAAAGPPGFTIKWIGAFYNSNEALPFSRDSYSSTYGGNPVYDPTVTKWGLRPEYSNIEDPIFPNSTVALACCKALWLENILQTNLGELEAEFIPGIQSGDFVRVTHRSYRLNRARFLVDKFSLAINFTEASATMVLGLIKPEGLF